MGFAFVVAFDLLCGLTLLVCIGWNSVCVLVLSWVCLGFCLFCFGLVCWLFRLSEAFGLMVCFIGVVAFGVGLLFVIFVLILSGSVLFCGCFATNFLF